MSKLIFSFLSTVSSAAIGSGNLLYMRITCPVRRQRLSVNSRMLIYDVNNEFDDSYRPIMDQSFVKPSCKHLNFLKSANFRAFMQQSIRLSEF
jgi:hypothetical protein